MSCDGRPRRCRRAQPICCTVWDCGIDSPPAATGHPTEPTSRGARAISTHAIGCSTVMEPAGTSIALASMRCCWQRPLMRARASWLTPGSSTWRAAAIAGRSRCQVTANPRSNRVTGWSTQPGGGRWLRGCWASAGPMQTTRSRCSLDSRLRPVLTTRCLSRAASAGGGIRRRCPIAICLLSISPMQTPLTDRSANGGTARSRRRTTRANGYEGALSFRSRSVARRPAVCRWRPATDGLPWATRCWPTIRYQVRDCYTQSRAAFVAAAALQQNATSEYADRALSYRHTYFRRRTDIYRNEGRWPLSQFWQRRQDFTDDSGIRLRRQSALP